MLVCYALVICNIVLYLVICCYITLHCFNFVCIAICLLMKLFTALVVKGGQHWWVLAFSGSLTLYLLYECICTVLFYSANKVYPSLSWNKYHVANLWHSKYGILIDYTEGNMHLLESLMDLMHCRSTEKNTKLGCCWQTARRIYANAKAWLT